ncbi:MULTISPECIES: FmdB family zinc ribbon protein [unclassified Arthrobacter]|uniref:FmdB family zinc ribbon protein n=1 Tax=unclassified Arthrobacter TaxID=235627 RepID=UPI002DFD7FCA|nr:MULTISPECIES: zinc ribbon domain-containing protein [unclassified Arthrobacter]MEC5202318.1 putative FmdB family regulatory protein [Arthrobacter sp. MP_M7]
MAIYEYRCPDDSPFEVSHRIGEAPDSLACPSCGKPSRRMISAPHLSKAGSAAFGLIDSTQRSASEPEIVNSQIPGTPRRVQSYSSNPLHRKLPRP